MRFQLPVKRVFTFLREQAFPLPGGPVVAVKPERCRGIKAAIGGIKQIEYLSGCRFLPAIRIRRVKIRCRTNLSAINQWNHKPVH
jgi:hypothetical protein